MREPTLRPSVDAHPFVRPRLVAIGVAALGAAASVLLLAAQAPPPAGPTPAPAPPPTPAIAPPVIVTVVVPAPTPAPPPAPAPAPDALRCPLIGADADADAEPIGVAITPADREHQLPEDPGTGPTLKVVAAAHAPRLAILTPDGKVRVSDDDGRTFARAFTDRAVDELRVDRDGTLYARAGTALGTRAFPGSTERWREVPVAACATETCRDRVATVDDRVIWVHDTQLATSTDHGATWHVATSAAPWSESDGNLFAWRGALYQVERYTDMCGIDDSPTWRFTPTATAVANTIFHNNYDGDGEAVLTASDDVGTSWTWQERCWDTDRTHFAACRDRKAAHSAMLVAKTLTPAEGARELAVYGNGLVELCPGGARQVYRAFPFEHVDAVDASGRPLVVHAGTVLRWSPTFGWRRLFRMPSVTK